MIKLANVHLILLISMTLLLSACGDSPFLEEAPEQEQERVIEALGSDLAFPASNIKIKPYWREGPRIGEESKLLIVLLSQNGTPLSENLDLRVKLWMPTMGHGSFPVTVKKVAGGVYEASEVFFTMPGYWDVHFQLYQDDKLDEEKRWGLNL